MPVLLHGYVLIDPEGGQRIWSIVQDLTPIKEVEAKLARSREERERFFTLPHNLMAIATNDGYFTYLSPGWEKALGYTIEELLGRPFIEFVHPEDRDTTLAEASNIAAGADTVAFENRYLCKDGSYRWLLWSAAFYPEEQLIYAAAHDITDRKHAAEEKQRLDVQLHQLQFLYRLRSALGLASSPSQVVEQAGAILAEVLEVSPPAGVLLEYNQRAWRFGHTDLDGLMVYERRLRWGDQDRGRLQLYLGAGLSPVQEQMLLEEGAARSARRWRHRNCNCRFSNRHSWSPSDRWPPAWRTN